MRPVALILIALVACSTAAKPDSAPDPRQTIHVAGASRGLSVVPSSDVHLDTLHIDLARVWKTMPAVYAALEIPIETYDPARNLLGTSGMKVYRRLGKTPLTRLLDCGRTQIGPNAESYQITMSAITTLSRIDSAMTVVVTTVVASGRPMQFGGSETRCRTTGELERQIALQLDARLNP